MRADSLEGRDDVVIVELPGVRGEMIDRGRRRVRTATIGTGMRQGVVDIGDRDDASRERDRFACESVGVAAAVAALVVSADRGRDGVKSG